MDTQVYMQSLLIYLELDLRDGFPEEFSLSGGDFKLKLSRRARAISTSEGTSAPRGS